MRPIGLTLEGFSAFRDRVEIDFGDAELFALVGPTGSGKSSVIDGITFALYGSVARYDDARLVAPVINQRSATAKVDLEFQIGTDIYRVFREVTRTKQGGASTREARLEQGDHVLAGDAKDVTAVVTRLLGLDFGQFTTCVVLPQGEFARFLHDTPTSRQELLVQLLDLGLYRSMAKRARTRAASAASQVELLDRQLGELRGRDLAEAVDVERRIEALQGLQAQVEEAQPRLDEMRRTALDAEAKADHCREQAGLLGDIEAPEDLESLAEAVITAELERGQADRDAEEAERAVEQAEAVRRDLPDRGALEATGRDRDEQARVQERVANERDRAAEAAATVAGAIAEADITARSTAEARRTLEAARTEHAAHALASELEIGEPCPVCHRPVERLPEHDLEDLDRLRATLGETERRQQDAEAVLGRAREDHGRSAGLLASLEGDLHELDVRLLGAPSALAVRSALAEVADADACVDRARTAARAAWEQRRGAERRRSKLDELEQACWRDLDRARDGVALLGPPPIDRADLAVAWQDLVGWRDEQRPALVAAADTAEKAAATAHRSREHLFDELSETGRRLGIEPGEQPIRDAVADALAAARAELVRVERLQAELERRSDERDGLAERAEVASLVGRLLRADGFVSWLLDEAVERLVAGATAKLRQLSRGQYSLAVDDKGSFLIVDHHNADESRLARTLSGGETFLASLALALSLSEQVAELSAEGAPRLESIFLDEGFGTLDPETLEVVVGAIEDLHATGRVVGLVSHVPELAERVPVRFEVVKGPTTSAVERVEP